MKQDYFRGWALTNPSLAITKYWGKIEGLGNYPATPSLAVGLAELTCETEVKITPAKKPGALPHKLCINGVFQDSQRFAGFFEELRVLAVSNGIDVPFSVYANSVCNFPVAAGIASSSAGFAALAMACVQALGMDLSLREISKLSRLGSASAARSVFGGFTFLGSGKGYAEVLHDAFFWPDFRILVVEVDQGKKKISSREAMECTRKTSPYYDSWLRESLKTTEHAIDALQRKDIECLGRLARHSYMGMFATMLSAQPPIIYWKPESLQVIHVLDSLRQEGLPCWETMDAGPQVKIFCEASSVPFLLDRLKFSVPRTKIRVCTVAQPPQMKQI